MSGRKKQDWCSIRYIIGVAQDYSLTSLEAFIDQDTGVHHQNFVLLTNSAENLRLEFRLLNSLILLHDLGVSHGDINPGSILAYRDGSASLFDFKIIDTFFIDLRSSSFLRKFERPQIKSFLSPEAMMGFFLGKEGHESFDAKPDDV